jgi:outer membrane protein OmpA-like peptidoglycan-associated protein
MRTYIPCFGILTAFTFMILVGGCATTSNDLGEERSQRTQLAENGVEENRARIEELSTRLDRHTSQIENQVSEQERLADEIDQMKTRLSEQEAMGERAKEAANAATASTEGRENILTTLSFSETIQFGFDKWDLTDEAKSKIDGLTQRIEELNSYLITLEGHTDSTGEPSYNLILGKRRAKAVYRYLADRKIPIYSLYKVSFSEDKPIAPNDNRENRALNRRVEIKVYSVSVK